MADNIYCYKGTSVLKTRLHIKDEETLFEVEKKLTLIRIHELQDHPIEGDFDYIHLQKIHHYIFQDIYSWAGKLRTVEIAKGNMICTTEYLKKYGESVFDNYFQSCYETKDSFEKFIKVFSSNYADLNALHPFREGNGRAQREFARLVCLKCGYILDLSATSHKEMLEASIDSFDKGDNSKLEKIFAKTVFPIEAYKEIDNKIRILSSDDLTLSFRDTVNSIEYYEEENHELIQKYSEYYSNKIKKYI